MSRLESTRVLDQVSFDNSPTYKQRQQSAVCFVLVQLRHIHYTHRTTSSSASTRGQCEGHSIGVIGIRITIMCRLLLLITTGTKYQVVSDIHTKTKAPHSLSNAIDNNTIITGCLESRWGWMVVVSDNASWDVNKCEWMGCSVELSSIQVNVG